MVDILSRILCGLFVDNPAAVISDAGSQANSKAAVAVPILEIGRRTLTRF